MSDYCSVDEREHRLQRWTPTGRYQAVPGKFLGIMADLSIGMKAFLYNEKGFSYLFGNASEAPVFQANGVPPTALVAGLSPSVGDLSTYIAQQVSAGINKFNIDEPIEDHRNYGANFVITASDIVLQHGGTLFFSDYHHYVCRSIFGHNHNPTAWTIEAAQNGSSASRGGTHCKWEDSSPGWTTDPRDYWTELRDALAPIGRFQHGWIQMTYISYGSYEWTPREKLELQFGHANNLGSVNTVFTYAMLDSEFSWSRVDTFLDVAVEFGWAQREEMLIEEIYCCPPDIVLATVPPCYLAATLDTGQRRWV